MKQVDGYWLPDREERVEELLKETRAQGRPAYQRHKLLAALRYLPAGSFRRLALDVGGHIGMWSLQLANQFDEVAAFEPDEEKHACFEANLAGHDNVRLHKVGLSDIAGHAGLVQKTGTSLKTHVKPGGDGILLSRLDDFNYVPDFIKIDVEGYEVFVVRGAEATIRRWQPVIIVEQKKEVATNRYGIGDQDALRLLESWGYRIREEFNGDFILTCGG